MKTTSVDGPRVTAPTRRKRIDHAGAGFADHLDATAAATDLGGVAASRALVAADALLGLQDIRSAPGEARQQARRHGEALLDGLEGLRRDLLGGTISANRLTGMANLLRGERHRSGDPRVDDVLDAIELRVEVELAKLQRDSRDDGAEGR